MGSKNLFSAGLAMNARSADPDPDGAAAFLPPPVEKRRERHERITKETKKSGATNAIRALYTVGGASGWPKQSKKRNGGTKNHVIRVATIKKKLLKHLIHPNGKTTSKETPQSAAEERTEQREPSHTRASGTAITTGSTAAAFH